MVLHEQTGLKIVKNERNKFCIVTLHHTADEHKRSPEWRREAAAGLTPEQAARELDIDYTAILGSKVFPEITEKKHLIVQTNLDFGPHQRYYGGFDYGIRNPSSFHVYTVVDGVTYSVFEIFRPCTNISEYVEEMRTFPYWNQIRFVAADPSLWNKRAEIDGLSTTQELFMRAGVRNMVPGSRDEEAWLTIMRKHWQSDNPTFCISDRCPNQIREFETAIYVNQSERQLLTSSFHETIEDKDNHSLDDCKYFMLRQPKGNQQQVSWNNSKIVNRWSLPGGRVPATPKKSDGKGYLLP